MTRWLAQVTPSPSDVPGIDSSSNPPVGLVLIVAAVLLLSLYVASRIARRNGPPQGPSDGWL